MLSLSTVINVKFVVLYMGPSSQMVTKIFFTFRPNKQSREVE